MNQTDPAPLRQPPRSPKAAMVAMNPWFVFTVDGKPCLFKKQRVSAKDKRGKAVFGHDWVPLGPVDAVAPGDCPSATLLDIRHLVREHLRGLT